MEKESAGKLKKKRKEKAMIESKKEHVMRQKENLSRKEQKPMATKERRGKTIQLKRYKKEFLENVK